MPGSPGERRLKIGDQIVRVFDADREPEQVGGSGAVSAFDRGAVLYQALDAAERGRSLPDLYPSR